MAHQEPTPVVKAAAVEDPQAKAVAGVLDEAANDPKPPTAHRLKARRTAASNALGTTAGTTRDHSCEDETVR
jgi:hypothetical protein